MSRLLLLSVLTGLAWSGCVAPQRQEPPSGSPAKTQSPAAADWPYSARAATFSPDAKPGFDTPEGVTRLLERRWSLADIKLFCTPERRLNPLWQNLVVDSPEAWKGRLYSDKNTGFDYIRWYATVRDGCVLAYSLNARWGEDFWVLEIGSPETVSKPPVVQPDSNDSCFIGPNKPK